MKCSQLGAPGPSPATFVPFLSPFVKLRANFLRFSFNKYSINFWKNLLRFGNKEPLNLILTSFYIWEIKIMTLKFFIRLPIIFLKLIGRFHLFDIIKLSKLNIAAKKTRKNWFLSIRKRFTAENSSHRRKIIPSEIAQSSPVHQNTVIKQFKVIENMTSCRLTIFLLNS